MYSLGDVNFEPSNVIHFTVKLISKFSLTSGCAAPSRPVNVDIRSVHMCGLTKNDRLSRFGNSWLVDCCNDVR